jgi:hypothetical protein
VLQALLLRRLLFRHLMLQVFQLFCHA